MSWMKALTLSWLLAVLAACACGGGGGGGGGNQCTAFTYSAWSPAVCDSSGRQTRTVLTSSPTGCTGGSPVLSQTCTPPTCTDLFVTPINYAGQEVVVGCYEPGTYSISGSITQTAGTCTVTFDYSSHWCQGTLSGNATDGYDITSTGCSSYITSASIHLPPNLSTFTGGFDWTVSCGSGTTTFENIVKQ